MKQLTSVNKTKKEQEKIYLTCKNYRNVSEETRAKIRKLCNEVGQDQADALFKLVTTDGNIIKVSMDHFCSQRRLYELRRKFYERW